MIYSHRYEDWKSKGVSIVPVISRPNLPESAEWSGLTGLLSAYIHTYIHISIKYTYIHTIGYIQDALKENGVKRPKNSAALLCGMRYALSSDCCLLVYVCVCT